MSPVEAITPYTLTIDEAALVDLRGRIRATRWPISVGLGWERGVPLRDLQRLARYWSEEFDWRAQEEQINRLPQFRTVVDGQVLHFLHLRSGRPDAVPLLMVHGWPSSPIEFLRVVRPLTAADGELAFDLVLPSLPGYGLSTPLQPGWGDLFVVAQALSALMQELGYDQYAVHGTDVGAGVADALALVDADRVVGTHVTGTVAAMPLGAELDTAGLTGTDLVRAQRFTEWQRDGLGYLHLQTTRPQTLAYALTDSPVGHLAWIVEKFHEWTDPAFAEPDVAVNLDQLLTNVSLSWFTRAAAASAHATYEGMQIYRQMAAGAKPSSALRDRPPAAVAVFAADTTIRQLIDPTGAIKHWSEFPCGGHFPAMETPDLLVEDLRGFFGALNSGPAVAATQSPSERTTHVSESDHRGLGAER
jgi:pimeloyl-ACP methyl ester carboxylesterase